MTMLEAALGALFALVMTIGGGLQALGEGFEVACIAAGGEYRVLDQEGDMPAYKGQWGCTGAVVTVPPAQS